MEKIWLGYLATLLLSAPIPSRRFVNYAHQMPAGQRHESYYIPKGEQVCHLLQQHGISKGEQVCHLLQQHGISKGEQVCHLLQQHGISKGEQVCLLLQPLCCGWFFAASLVMEPSCSALMAASPPGPADARIGLIGTASQQPA